MKRAVTSHLPNEHYVIRVDGRVRSHHQRFADALREGLHLRDEFPGHNVKVLAMQLSGDLRIARRWLG